MLKKLGNSEAGRLQRLLLGTIIEETPDGDSYGIELQGAVDDEEEES